MFQRNTFYTNQIPRYLLELKNHLLTQKKAKKSAYMLNSYVRFFADMSAICWFVPELSFYMHEDDIMAKKDWQNNLIDYRLNDAELEAFEKWVSKSPPSFTSVLADLAIMNYKVSFSFVDHSESWCVSITGKSDAKFNDGVTITTWSDDAEEAMLMAFFKVTVIFDRGKWVAKSRSNRG